jgi:hypothetical protein
LRPQHKRSSVCVTRSTPAPGSFRRSLNASCNVSTVRRCAIDEKFRSLSSFASSAIRMCSGDMVRALGVHFIRCRRDNIEHHGERHVVRRSGCRGSECPSGFHQTKEIRARVPSKASPLHTRLFFHAEGSVKGTIDRITVLPVMDSISSRPPIWCNRSRIPIRPRPDEACCPMLLVERVDRRISGGIPLPSSMMLSVI